VFVSREARPLRDRLLLRLLDLVDSNAAGNPAKAATPPRLAEHAPRHDRGQPPEREPGVGRPDFRLLRFAAKAAATSSSTWTDWVMLSKRVWPVMPVRDRHSDPIVP